MRFLAASVPKRKTRILVVQVGEGLYAEAVSGQVWRGESQGRSPSCGTLVYGDGSVRDLSVGLVRLTEKVEAGF